MSVGPAGAALQAEIETHADVLRERYADRGVTPSEALQPARRLYRAFGIDPTKTRPSSEALLRRVLRGKPLPRILNAVDLGNYLSLRFLLPIGLYDADRLDPPVTLRRGEPGESYAGIRKDEVHLAGRPALVDRAGPFGNPSSDSLRTSVGEATRALWLVVFAPASYPGERMAEHVAEARQAMRRHLAAPGATPETRGSVQ